ncbi:hypothetical protein XCR_2943 [Xanthomonas campestris pv. raphani 756C]|nr:hypothetical protein XCR_2943 [Xanthomonas campestris pv. raphani 756C]
MHAAVAVIALASGGAVMWCGAMRWSPQMLGIHAQSHALGSRA